MTRNESAGGLSRREALAALGTVGGSMLAGCGSTTQPAEPTPSKYPAVDISLGERWMVQTSIKKPIKVKRIPVSAYTKAQVHADTQADSDLNSVLPSPIRVPLVSLIVGKVNVFSRGFPGKYAFGFVSPKRVVDNTIDELKSRIKSKYDGQNIRKVWGGDKPDQAVATKEFTAGYPVRRTKTVTIDGQQKDVQLSGAIVIRAFVSAWELEGSEDLGLAGGVYPSSRSFELAGSVTGARSSGVDVEVTVTTGIDPDATRRRLVKIIESLSLE